MADFWTDFLAPFLGVFAAFALNWMAGRVKDWRDRKALLGRLHDELKTDLQRLSGKGNILNDMIWESALAAGQLRLLSRNHVAKLTEVYQGVKNTVYEALRLRDVAEDYRRAQATEREPVLESLWITFSAKHEDREEKLRRQIQELLKCSWLRGKRTRKV